MYLSYSSYYVSYQAHVQNQGWQGWVSDGEVAGTTGHSLRMEALRIKVWHDGSFINSNTNANSEYNRGKACSYATKYATSPNVFYHDFTPNGGDCTNFVSQCLGDKSEGGGITQIYPQYQGSTNYKDKNNWYSTYAYSPNPPVIPETVSYTWSAASNFRTHWANENSDGMNRAYKYKEYPDARAVLDDWDYVSTKLLWNGDVIQLIDPATGKAHHSMIIYGYHYNPTYGVTDFKYAQHTDNKSVESLYNNLKSWADSSANDRIGFYEMKNGG